MKQTRSRITANDDDNHDDGDKRTTSQIFTYPSVEHELSVRACALARPNALAGGKSPT
jgi:hypothetical protein